MKIPYKISPFFIALLIFLTCSSLAYCEEKSFLWEVKSNTTKVYVLGSIHFAKPEMYPLSKAIENGFKESENLVLELDPVSIDKLKMQKLMMEKGMYSGSKTIKDDLTIEVFQNLNNHLEKNNIPLAKIEKMKPGLLAITLSTFKILQMGFLPQFGIDMYFALKAAQVNKNILELETVEQQMNLLLNMPNENLFLKYTLRDLDESEKLLYKLISFWENGDAQGINSMILEPYEDDPELEIIIEELFFTRNNQMTEKIKGFLKTDETYFVVVGAGHLVGNKGIINQLKKSKYSVKQL